MRLRLRLRLLRRILEVGRQLLELPVHQQLVMSSRNGRIVSVGIRMQGRNFASYPSILALRMMLLLLMGVVVVMMAVAVVGVGVGVRQRLRVRVSMMRLMRMRMRMRVRMLVHR